MMPLMKDISRPMKMLCELRAAGRILWCVLAMLLCGDWAHAASPEFTGKVSRLMEASGINHSVTQMLPSVLGTFDAVQQQQSLPAYIHAALRDAAMQGFQTAVMLEKVRARLATLNEKQIDDTLAWLGTPLGRRITGLENAASDAAAMPKLMAFMEELQKRPAPAPRLRLIQELIRATGGVDMANNVTEATAMATALGINAAQPRQQQAPAETIRKQVKASIPQMQKQTEQMMTSTMLYTYRPLSDKEIETYINFANSASGAAYHKGAVAGVSDALLEAIARFMTAIPKSMERTKGAVGA